MEQDASLTRNDYFTHGGDNFSFNTTLWEQGVEITGGLFDLDGVADWRYARYLQSKQENPWFYWGPLFFFQHGAASFLYELWPNGNEGYVPTLENTATFFGAKRRSDGSWERVPERIPDNWVNRKTPYTLLGIAGEIIKMYAKHPTGIGGNVDGKFVGIDFPPYIRGGKSEASTPADILCLFYQALTRPIPSSLNGVVTPVVEGLSAVLQAVFGNDFDNLGCPLPLTK